MARQLSQLSSRFKILAPNIVQKKKKCKRKMLQFLRIKKKINNPEH